MHKMHIGEMPFEIWLFVWHVLTNFAQYFNFPIASNDNLIQTWRYFWYHGSMYWTQTWARVSYCDWNIRCCRIQRILSRTKSCNIGRNSFHFETSLTLFCPIFYANTFRKIKWHFSYNLKRTAGNFNLTRSKDVVQLNSQVNKTAFHSFRQWRAVTRSTSHVGCQQP